jgi:hypothetical protein
VPRLIWLALAEASGRAFETAGSITLVSLYTTLASQLVGNVAVVIMLSEDLVMLEEDTQRFAWVVLAWVSTGKCVILGYW